MSFCYAEINNDLEPNSVFIYTDTKIGFDNYSGASFSPNGLALRFGMEMCARKKHTKTAISAHEAGADVP